MNNCKTCLYSNELDSGRVLCDRVFLLNGKTVHIDVDKVELVCPSHSSNPIHEIRYGYGDGDMRDSDDACVVCGRRVKLSDSSTHTYVAGSSEDIICRICTEKGRG